MRTDTRFGVEMPSRGERGKAGGHARAAKMSPEQRRATARKAAQARWAKENGSTYDAAPVQNYIESDSPVLYYVKNLKGGFTVELNLTPYVGLPQTGIVCQIPIDRKHMHLGLDELRNLYPCPALKTEVTLA